MPAKRQTWTVAFDSPAERIWPLLADTARYNEAAELPNHAIAETPRPDGSVEAVARGRVGLVALEWEELPVNWIAERWFEHPRVFRRGPLRSLTARLELTPGEDGCTGDYTVIAEPATPFGRLMLATGFFPAAEKTFRTLAAEARDFAAGRRETEFEVKPPKLADGVRDRVSEMIRRVEDTPHGHGLAQRLAEMVLTRQEADLWTIRPLRLARLWSVADRDAIELCLEAVKQGLLRLRWDLLCPRCQVGKDSALSMDRLPRGAHCPTCNVDYGRDYANNVELAFFPAAAVRALKTGEYCRLSPMSTPHIRAQITLAPGERREEAWPAPPGHYRLRTLEPGGESLVQWDGGGFPEVIVAGADVRAGEAANPGTLALSNAGDIPRTVVVEELGWRRDALTAARVTALQAFRDLFTEEVLRPGDDVEIDHITLMFTDLKGSTALYERIGDPQAYALVREHYAVIGRAVRAHDGAVVKTIGDAVMAVFTEPADGLRCALQIHDDFEAYNATSGREPVVIKLGLHVGRCISVTLNNRLDYYGTAANMAARLQGYSTGGDVVLSEAMVADPTVAAMLKGFAPVREAANLKGYDKPVPFRRITAEDVARRREAR